MGDGGGAMGDGGAPTTPDASLALSAITIAQSLEISLMRAGSAVPTSQRRVPLLAGKRALVRGFVTLQPDFASRELIGVLDLKSPGASDTFVDRRVISMSSLQTELGSTFQFTVEARDLEQATGYRLRVLDTDKTPLVRFPERGYASLGAEPRQGFNVMLVPMVANGVTPSTGPDVLDGVRQRLMELYPVSEVTLDVAEPLAVAAHLGPNDDNAWGDALDALLAARAAAEPADDTFYYGLLTPAANYDDYCFNGCYLGLSYIGSSDSPFDRGAIGLSEFGDGSGATDAWDTLTHELGHAIGREHSPCGVDDDVDAAFPYPAGDLGKTYGFDPTLQKLLRPTAYKDVMGYCSPVWVSDYTYRGIYDALLAIEAQPAFRARTFGAPERLLVARIGRGGVTSWRADSAGALSGELSQVALLDAAGRELGFVQARFRRLDHAPGGTLWLRATELAQSGAALVDLRPFGGKPLPLRAP
jgi:hypothetical protein